MGANNTNSRTPFTAISLPFVYLFSAGFRRHCAHAAMFAAATFFAASMASATLINFDDLPPLVGDDPSEPTPVTNQYAALGVLFDTAAIATDVPGVRSGLNGITDFYGPDMQIRFTGSLPTSLSMFVSSANQDSIFIDVFGADGLLGSIATDGWRGTEEMSTPYRDQQLVTFSGAPISYLNIGSFYFRRGSLLIDDLMFTNDSTSVPEPAALSLLAAGWVLLMAQRRRLQQLR